jgi:hypothetical protein
MRKFNRDYYVQMTLLGSDPDVNRRTIYYGHPHEAGRLVAIFNADMRPWTPELVGELEACLVALRSMRG